MHRLAPAVALAWAFVLLACSAGGEDAPGAVSSPSSTPQAASPTPQAASPATRTLVAVADTTIYAEAGDRSNGAGEAIFADRNNNGAPRRALVRFDLASVPRGLVVAFATLTLTMDRSAVGPRTVTVHRMLASWGEAGSHAAEREGMGAPAQPGDATWTQRSFSDTTWQTPGGDFIEGSSADATVAAPGPYAWTSSQLAADVQSWLEDPTTNFGWILLADESERRAAKRFASRSHPDADLRPTLTIELAPTE